MGYCASIYPDKDGKKVSDGVHILMDGIHGGENHKFSFQII